MNTMIGPYDLPDINAEELALLLKCINQLETKVPVNAKRTLYYDAEQIVQHLGISVPKSLEAVQTVIGWPAKSVDMLESRIDLDGFVLPSASASDFDLDRIWDDNHLNMEAPQAHLTALKYGCAFLAVTKGEPNEPDVVIRALSPVNSTVIWDKNRRCTKAALTADVDDEAKTVRIVMFTETATITATRIDGLDWDIERVEHRLGRVPVVPLVFKPSLEAPFGRSRISKAVMSITDRAIRSLLRMEISAEFYASPQRYLLGASSDSFVGADGNPKDNWSVLLSKMLAVPHDEDGNEPKLGQFPQMTMQPHMDMVRAEAAMFAGETDIPVNVLGVVHDNPASDAAMHTAYLSLDKTAERAHSTFGAGWIEAMQLAWRINNDADELPDELRGLQSVFRDPSTPTKAALAQAVVSQIQVGALPAISEVTYELLGYDRSTITRLMAASRDMAGDKTLRDLIAAVPVEPERLRNNLDSQAL